MDLSFSNPYLLYIPFVSDWSNPVSGSQSSLPPSVVERPHTHPILLPLPYPMWPGLLLFFLHAVQLPTHRAFLWLVPLYNNIIVDLPFDIVISDLCRLVHFQWWALHILLLTRENGFTFSKNLQSFYLPFYCPAILTRFFSFILAPSLPCMEQSGHVCHTDMQL